MVSPVGVACHAVWDYGCSIGKGYIFHITAPYFTVTSIVFLPCELSKYNSKALGEGLQSTTCYSQSSSCWHTGRCLSSRSLHPDTNSPGHWLVAVSQDWQATSHSGEGGAPKSFYKLLSGHRGLSETSHLLIPFSLWRCGD